MHRRAKRPREALLAIHSALAKLFADHRSEHATVLKRERCESHRQRRKILIPGNLQKFQYNVE